MYTSISSRMSAPAKLLGLPDGIVCIKNHMASPEDTHIKGTAEEQRAT
jgi:hypothetical protein